MLEFGNLFYYISVVFITVNVTIISVLFLKNKSEKFQYVFIFFILFSGFVLHFLKLGFEPYYSRWPKSLSNITFENICAVNTLLFPWVYLTKKQLLKDYMVVIGLVSGFGAVIYPYQSHGFTHITFDILRFYYDHYILFLAPFLMLFTGIYKFNSKNVFRVPLVFYGVLMIIFTNEVFLIALGIIDGNFTTLLDPNIRNAALIFGPNKQLSRYEWIYSPFVPKIFKTIPFGAYAGSLMYWPIIWLIIPSYIYLCLGGVIIDVLIKVFKRKENPNIYTIPEIQSI